MSGPKDFGIIYAISRLAEMEARRLAEAQVRNAASQARLAQQQRIAQKRVAEMTALRAAQESAARSRAADTNANLAERRDTLARLTAERLAKARIATAKTQERARQSGVLLPPSVDSDTCDMIGELASSSDIEAKTAAAKLLDQISSSNSVQHSPADATEVIDRVQRETKQAIDAAVVRAKKLTELVEQLISWQAEMQQDQAANQFCCDQLTKWQNDTTSLINDYESSRSTDQLLHRSESLLAEAEHLHRDAGDKQAAFNTRNELLADVIVSLQEIGFFVSDPSFENAADPAGPVLVKASRGREEVVATVDLTDLVRSVWNGVGEEHCKDTFFQYIDQMKSKGIEVKPTRSDLQDRPKLKQKGARSLPNSEQRRRGE